MKRIQILFLLIWLVLVNSIDVMSQSCDQNVIETPNLRVEISIGGITGIFNKLTGEQYIDSSSSADGMGLLHTGNYSILSNQYARFHSYCQNDTLIMTLISALNDSISTYAFGDQETGEVFIWQEGALSRSGVVGSRISFSSFDLHAGRLVLPIIGGVSIDYDSGVLETSATYLTDWESQLAIFESDKGTLGMWFDDSLFAAKKISFNRSESRMKLSFEVHNPGNFSTRSSISTPALRLQAYTEDWRAPAKDYRNWMIERYQPKHFDEKPAWIDSIGCVVIYHAAQTNEVLDSLAQNMNSSQTLIYVPNWRMEEYDVNYPDYTPNTQIASFIQYAHQLGFRVMLHVNPYGIAPYHELYPQFQPFQLTNPFNGEIYGWHLNTQKPTRHVLINPASVELQDMFLGKIQDITALQPDAFHLDVDFATMNSNNGIINGENPAMGNRTFHRRLADEFPTLVWGGEILTEVSFYRDSFNQRWKTNTESWNPHPISSYLFHQYTLPIGHLSLTNPDEDPDSYAEFMKSYENWGIMPTVVVNSAKSLSGARTQDLIRIADVWARLGLKPDFESDWAENTLFRFKGRNGERAEYIETEYGTNFVVNGDNLYNKVSGVNRLSTQRSIIGWYGYNETEIFGLNPDVIYWLDDVPNDLSQAHLHELSSNAIVECMSISDQGGHFSLRGLYTHGEINLVDRLNEANWKIRIGGEVQAIGYGAFVTKSLITLGGITKEGIKTQVPYEDITGDVIINYTVSLPDSPNVKLSFYAGLDEDVQITDGVGYFVEVNDEVIFTTLVTEKVWNLFEVDLSAWRGQSIQLTIGNNPGSPGSNTDGDLSRWSDIIIRTAEEHEFQFQAQIYSTSTVDVDGGIVNVVGDGFYEISGNLPAELSFAVKNDPVTIPYNIVENFSNIVGTKHGGLYSKDNRAHYAGDIRQISCGGITKLAINGHPPSQGSTILQQTVTLSTATPLFLLGSYGIADESFTGGVTFSIYINGIKMLTRTTGQTMWFNFEIDLSPFVGKSILIEFVTSPGVDNYYDWANWADLTISETGTVDVDGKSGTVPKSYTLSEPYPNPFNNIVVLNLSTPKQGNGQLKIYDIRGRIVYSEKISIPAHGQKVIRWNGNNLYGNLVGSGVYFLKVDFEEKNWIKKIVLLK